MLFLVFNFLDFAGWLIIINYFLHFRRRSCFSGSHVSDFSRWSKAQDLQLRVTSCLEIVIHTLAWRLLHKISPTWIYRMKSEIILLNIFILDAVKIGISLSVLKLLSSLAFAGLQAFHLWILLLSLHVVLVLEVYWLWKVVHEVHLAAFWLLGSIAHTKLDVIIGSVKYMFAFFQKKRIILSLLNNLTFLL